MEGPENGWDEVERKEVFIRGEEGWERRELVELSEEEIGTGRLCQRR